jgi:PAS domain S-box-containing protein
MYDAVSIIDVNTRRLIKVNSTFLENHGLSEDDVIGKTCHEITHHLPKPCSSSGDQCPLDNAIMTGMSSVAEHMHCHNNGETFHVEESASPIKNEYNEITQVVLVSRDVTNRKLTKDALRESEERYRRLVELSPDAIFIQCEGRIVFINRAGVKLFGADDSGQLLGRSKFDLIHPDYHEIIKERVRQLQDDQIGVPPLEEQYLRLDGTPVDVEVAAAPFTYRNRPAVLVIARDITDRKLTAEALRQSEERFRQIFEQSTDALFVLKAATRKIIDVNPAAEKLYGYTREEFIGDDTSLILERDECGKYEQALADSGTTGNIRIDQLTTMKKDGTTAIVSVWGYIVRLKESKVLTCSFRDITEKVRLEEEAKLIQAKLIQTNKMTSLGTLVSGVAHEINNPNNYISFNAQLISDIWQDLFLLLTEYGEKNADFPIGNIPFFELREIIPKLLKGISEGSHRINNIVNNLKDYARKDSANLNEEIDIHKVIANAASLLSSQIRKHARKFDMDFASDIPPIKGNAQQLEQVIVNLITNALQALSDREGGIGITTFFEEEKQSIIIQVKDEGAGMPREVLDRIPEPFFTTKLAQGGTGLGLSISNSIIKDHQGALKFESEPGKGTIITVVLPIGEDAARKDL